MSNDHLFSQTPEPFEETLICEILKPLKQETTSIEYICQYKAIAEFNKRYRSLEALYADIYSKIARLDKEIGQQKDLKQNLSNLNHGVRNNFS